MQSLSERVEEKKLLFLCRHVSNQAAGSVPIPAAPRPSEEDTSHLRLGLRVEQRGSLRQLLRLMKQRLESASSDLQVHLQSSAAVFEE